MKGEWFSFMSFNERLACVPKTVSEVTQWVNWNKSQPYHHHHFFSFIQFNLSYSYWTRVYKSLNGCLFSEFSGLCYFFDESDSGIVCNVVQLKELPSILKWFFVVARLWIFCILYKSTTFINKGWKEDPSFLLLSGTMKLNWPLIDHVWESFCLCYS